MEITFATITFVIFYGMAFYIAIIKTTKEVIKS